jgi:phage shock protein PspC (stress-responsive transcriptional regulator)
VPSHRVNFSKETAMKRISRTLSDRRIAGVCGGLGEYFELDPVLFRLTFLLLLFLGGVGVLAYVALWIMVPPNSEGAPARSGMRLRRSRGERRIAGVCGGIGEYLEIDPVLVRVVFIMLAFAGGFGIALYVAFWIAMPDSVADDHQVARASNQGSPT